MSVMKSKTNEPFRLPNSAGELSQHLRVAGYAELAELCNKLELEFASDLLALLREVSDTLCKAPTEWLPYEVID